MPNDAAYGSPQGGGDQTRTFLFVLVGGIGAYLLYRHYKGSGSVLGGGTTATTTAPSSPYTIDPSTGIPINPSTGLDFGAPGTGATASGATQNSWLTSAEQSLVGAGYDPGLVNRSLFDYLNGNSLDNQEQGAISTALGKVGFPPNLPPFLATPTPPGNPTSPTTPTPVVPIPTTPLPIINKIKPPKIKLPKPKPPKPKPHIPRPTGSPGSMILNAGTLRGGSPS